MKRKPEFLTNLDTRQINSRSFALLKPLYYYSAYLDKTIVVPQGFVCDGTSDLLKDDTKGPAVLHDNGYRSPDHEIDILVNEDGRGVLKKYKISKHEIDMVFKEAMKVWKKPETKFGKTVYFFERWMKYLGVVVGGHSSYRDGPSKYKKIDIKE